VSSITIETLPSEYPGRSDAEAAQAYAQGHAFLAMVGYRNSGSTELSNVGCCRTGLQLLDYLSSPFCLDAEVIWATAELREALELMEKEKAEREANRRRQLEQAASLTPIDVSQSGFVADKDESVYLAMDAELGTVENGSYKSSSRPSRARPSCRASESCGGYVRRTPRS
jgi:hypothetical protein